MKCNSIKASLQRESIVVRISFQSYLRLSNFRLGCVSDRPMDSTHVSGVCSHHSTKEGTDELAITTAENPLVNKSANSKIT